jgi:F420-dependent oxidoreductase-like protein
MKFSVFLPTGFTLDYMGIPDPVAAYEKMTEIAKVADDAGFETLWLADHLTPAVPAPATVFEVWISLAALARDTRRVRLGHMVTCNSYRNPAHLAKMASTLDVLSHGRLAFGIGAGWHEPDYTGYGYDFHDAGTRLRHLREAVQIIRAMWTEDEVTFEGKYYQVRGAVNQPKGVQSPHIPMLIAGAGEKVTLKLVAQYGDGCNVIESPEGLIHKYSILQDHCTAVERDYDSILKTTCSYCVITDTDEEAKALIPAWAPAVFPGDLASYGMVGTIDTIRDRIAAYEAVGVQEVAITFGQAVENPDILRQFAEEFIH